MSASSAAAGMISMAVKSCMIALVDIHIIPWSTAQVASVAMALSTVVDCLLYFGLIHEPAIRRDSDDEDDTDAHVSLSDMYDAPEQEPPYGFAPVEA